MVFKSFRVNVLLRVILLALTVIGSVLLAISAKYVSATLFGVAAIFQIYNLWLYVESTNRKLSHFLEAIRYSDFSTKFEIDNKLGRSFEQLNYSFQAVLDAFRESRKENEENLQYLNTVVQHVNVGLISFNPSGHIEVMNNQASRLLEIPKVHHIDEIAANNSRAANHIAQLSPGNQSLFRQSDDKHLSINMTEMRLRGNVYRLVAVQNIQSELQQNELEAWQNLTRVLRHEIMNSITPITSLIATLQEIFEEEFQSSGSGPKQETVEDVSEALQTIQNRSEALKQFVQAYKHFTQIPEPVKQWTEVATLFEGMEQLMQGEFRQYGIEFDSRILPERLQIRIDKALIEMVLINLLKNAVEALRDQPTAKIELKGFSENSQTAEITVADNGPGIIPEAIEQIFIPFYTTKPGGSGIGLSLSRQIMHMHQGALTVESTPGVGTVFYLRFNN